MKTLSPLDSLVESTFEIGRIMRQCMMNVPGAGANFLQLHALLIISEQPGITMKEIAGLLHVTSPSATSLINRLAKLQWVSRKHDRKNRKLVRLTISAVGRSFLAQKHRERNQVLQQLFQLLTPDEQSTLAALHAKILREYEHRPVSPR